MLVTRSGHSAFNAVADLVWLARDAPDTAVTWVVRRPSLGQVFGGDDRHDGRLLGAQILGHWRAEVAKRIDVVATALVHGMRVDELNDLDLSYTPPVSSPWDPVQMAAQAWARDRNRYA